MEKNWVKIFSTGEVHVARLLKAVLENEEIEVVEMNHHDSSMTVLGEVELYVKSSDALRSKYLIDKNNP